MKKVFSCLMSICLLASSCINTDEQQPDSIKESYLANQALLTKSITDRLSEGITQADVENYMVYMMSIIPDEIKDITKYDLDEDTYIYIVNLKDGRWFIFSGDYSTSPIVIKGSHNGFYLEKDLSALPRHDRLWLESLRDVIVKNRTTMSEETRRNQSEWIHSNTLAMRLSGRRSGGIRSEDPDTIEVDIQLIIDTLIYENYPGLTSTSWDQSVPWNNAMPKYTTNDRCLAGCTVIGIAQLLYYTHYHFGFPNEIYESASCDDYYSDGPPYSFVLTNPTTTSWDQMVLSFDDDPLCMFDPYMPALCALIAQRSGTAYGVDPLINPLLYDPTYGSTPVANVPSTMSSFFLYGTSQESYTKADVINEIQNGRPVLTGGTANQNETSGHAFLIDGYYWIKCREIEQVRDMSGNLIQETIYMHENFYWNINTGNPSAHHIQSAEYAYYPNNRIIFIGWSQN